MLESNPLIRENMGRNARNYAMKNYSIERIDKKLEHTLTSAIMHNNVERSLETNTKTDA